MAADRSARTLIESRFPAYGVSRVAVADRRSRDPAYASHTRWARRPPSVMRAILLAAALPGRCSQNKFWRLYESSTDTLSGLRVLDPFMGGGSTLIEAARLGASVAGTDTDPTSQLIVAHALDPPEHSALIEASEDLLSYLRSHFVHLYPDEAGEPLHCFWVPSVVCPRCGRTGLLYRSLVLTRDAAKPGAVVRDHAMTVFDPDTLELHYLKDVSTETFQGRRRSWPVDHATFTAFRYRCGNCEQRSTHRELQTAAAAHKLVAIERTPRGRRRRLYAPAAADIEATQQAELMLADPPVTVRLPEGEFNLRRSDPRPRSYGIVSFQDMFTARQLLVLGAAHAWVDTQPLDAPTERALKVALSNAVITNNRLCAYITDYGRMAGLFSIHGYALPAMPIELNPLHSSGGRGSLVACLRRVARSSTNSVKRSVWDCAASTTRSQTLQQPVRAAADDIRCASASDPAPPRSADLVVFDPPYYDYLDYDDLAEVFRAWNTSPSPAGGPLQQSVTAGPDSFGASLAACLRPGLAARRSGSPIVFTYHSANPDAWAAVAVALDQLDLAVTAMWPVRSDTHMGHHSNPGNCEWDVVTVCRPRSETAPTHLAASVEGWTILAADLHVSDADRAGFMHALNVAAPRWARPL